MKKGRGPSYGLSAEQKFTLWAGQPTADGCVIWQGPRRDRADGPVYGCMNVAGGRILAHRYAWERANGTIPDGLSVLHKCDNGLCVNLGHLFLGSALDNNRDRAAKGRNADTRGERNPFAKLTRKQVAAIRSVPKRHGSGVKLAKQYNVSPSTISLVRLGRVWQ